MSRRPQPPGLPFGAASARRPLPASFISTATASRRQTPYSVAANPRMPAGSADSHELTYFSITYFNSTGDIQPARIDQTLLVSLYNEMAKDDIEISVGRFRIPTNNVPLALHNIPDGEWAVGLSTDANEPTVAIVRPIGWVPEYIPPTPPTEPTKAYCLYGGSPGNWYLGIGPSAPTSTWPVDPWQPSIQSVSLLGSNFNEPCFVENSWGSSLGVFDVASGSPMVLVWHYQDEQFSISTSSPNWTIDITSFLDENDDPLWERAYGAAFGPTGDLWLMMKTAIVPIRVEVVKFTKDTQTWVHEMFYPTPDWLATVGFGVFNDTSFTANNNSDPTVSINNYGVATHDIIVTGMLSFCVSAMNGDECAVICLRSNAGTPANYDLVYFTYNTATDTVGAIVPIESNFTSQGESLMAMGEYQGPGLAFLFNPTNQYYSSGGEGGALTTPVITFDLEGSPSINGFVSLPNWQPPTPPIIPAHFPDMPITLFQQYCNQINAAFAAVLALSPAGWDTELVPPPYIQFDPLNRMFYLNLTDDYSFGYTDGSVHYRIWLNSTMQGLFSFPLSSSIEPTSTVTPMPSTPDPPLYYCLESDVPNASGPYKLYQERSSMGRLNDFARVIVQSTSFTVNGNQEGANSSVQCITDTVPDVDSLTPGAALIYVPFFDRWYTILQGSPLYRINIEINYQARDATVHPINVSPGDFWSVLLVFRRRSAS